MTHVKVQIREPVSEIDTCESSLISKFDIPLTFEF